MIDLKYRIAQLDDVVSLAPLCFEMWRNTRFHEFDIDKKKLSHSLLSAVTDSNQIIFIVEDSIGIFGALGAEIRTHVFSQARFSNDTFFYVCERRRNFRYSKKLISNYIYWAKSKKVDEILLGVATKYEIDRIGKFYRRMGFVPIGGVYSYE